MICCHALSAATSPSTKIISAMSALWVKSGHGVTYAACPLYPQKRTCRDAWLLPLSRSNFRWSFGRKSQLSVPKTHPHELMVKTSTRGTGTDFIFGRDKPLMHDHSGRDRKRWHLRPLIDYLVDQAEILGHLRRHKIVALQHVFDLLQRLAGMLHVDLVERLLEI